MIPGTYSVRFQENLLGIRVGCFFGLSIKANRDVNVNNVWLIIEYPNDHYISRQSRSVGQQGAYS